MFVVIEGGDASGKTVAINLLHQKVKDGEIPSLRPENTVFLKSPTHPFSEIWRSADTAHMDSLTRFYFFRTIAQNDARVVRNYLSQNINVVLERNIYSTEAFNETLDEMLKIQDPAMQSKNHLNREGLCKPDIAFLLDVPDEVRNRRIYKRMQEAKKVSWWERPDFQHTFNEKLRKIGKREKMITIDTSIHSNEAVVQIITENIAKQSKNQQIASIVQSLKKFKDAAGY